MPTRRAALIRSAACLIGAWLALTAPASADDIAQPASRLITDLGDKAIKTLTEKTLSPAERQKRFETLFNDTFDVPVIARFALGRYWRTLSPEQQADYVHLFEQMVVKTYADRFAEYNGEKFKVTGGRMESDSIALVTTDVDRPGTDQATVVNWRVQKSPNDGLKIIDVIIEGVSMSVTEQQEFSSVIQRNGGQVEPLLQAMRQRIAKN